jgi:methylenetetrahydrofolate dehydrogenase (NADP+) / methenyltetrahydrofolate cyclohydrolase
MIIDGKKISEKIKETIKKEVSSLSKKPTLTAISLGNNPASELYLKIKKKACDETGIIFNEIKLPQDTSTEHLVNEINKLNTNKEVNAILIQLPLPKQIDREKVFSSISLKKDVEGFNPLNVGKLFYNFPSVMPCTPKGVLRILEEIKVNLEGKDVVIVGASNHVGKPLAFNLLSKEATVTFCHIKTRNLKEKTLNADIIIVAAGKPNLINKDMVKESTIVIDIGINKLNGKIVGDVDFEDVKQKAYLITPVPGGVGPMTVAMLLENTLELLKDE